MESARFSVVMQASPSHCEWGRARLRTWRRRALTALTGFWLGLACSPPSSTPRALPAVPGVVGTPTPMSHDALESPHRNKATGNASSCVSPATTSSRPQLSRQQAVALTSKAYFAHKGKVAAPTLDPWDPNTELEDVSELAPDFVVAADGSGAHSSVQAAVTAARDRLPASEALAEARKRVYILIKPGVYRETVVVPVDAPPLTLYAEGPDARRVVIVDGKSAASAGGTSESATVSVFADAFQALNLTISNDFETPASGTGLQAVALKTTGDRVVLRNVRLHGYQDTLYLDSASPTTIARVYIHSSYIEGDTDFIFGRAAAVIQDSTIHYLHDRRGTVPGIILAPSTHVAYGFGFLVVGSVFSAAADAPEHLTYLGRAWDTSTTSPTPNGQALVRDCVLGRHLRQHDPWTKAATSAREFDATKNRLYEYCNRVGD